MQNSKDVVCHKIIFHNGPQAAEHWCYLNIPPQVLHNILIAGLLASENSVKKKHNIKKLIPYFLSYAQIETQTI